MAKLKIISILYIILRNIFYLFCFLLFLLLSLFIIINIPSVKEKIAKAGIDYLNKEFKTEIVAKNIQVDYFGNLIFKQVSAKDHHKLPFIKIEELKAYTNTFSLIQNLVIDGVDKIEINQIRLFQPIVQVITYKGESSDNFSLFVSKFKSNKPKSDKPFFLEGRVDIVDGKLSIINENLPNNEQVWLMASDLFLKASKINIIDSDVKINVEQLHFNGKRHNENYSLEQLSGFVHYSPTQLYFKNLTLESDTSLLLGSLLFTYTEKNGLSNFSDQVHWNLDLKDGSKISGKDIRYFVKNWNSDSIINVNATAKGTLNHMKIENPIISVAKTFYTSQSLLLKNLVGEKERNAFSIISMKSLLQTSYSSLNSWMPKFILTKIPKEINNLGIANYNGDFSINTHSLHTKGSLISSLGKIEADAQLKDYSSNIPKYEGWIKTENTNLAPFTKSSLLGGINSYIKFKGIGLKLNDLNVNFDANFYTINIKGKQITSLSTIGSIKDKVFDGTINSKDNNANIDFKGLINFKTKKIKTLFTTNIQKLNLSYFIPSTNKENTIFSGNFKSDIEFTNINDLTGEIFLNSVTLKKDTLINHFNDIDIKTTVENGNRNLDIFSSEMIAANIYGRYRLIDIPEMLQEGIGNLLVNYKPKKYFKNSEFSFVLDVRKNLFELLMLDINISPGTTITGRYIGKDNELQAQLISEYIFYKNIKLYNPNIFLNTQDSTKQFRGVLSSLNLNNTKINNINLSGFKRNDSLFVSTNFDYGKYKDKQTHFNLNLYHTRINNDFIFGFKPSSINLPNASWNLHSDSKTEEAIAKYNVISNKVTLKDIKLTSGESSLSLSGEYTNKELYNFNLHVEKAELAKLIPENFIKDMDFEGLANGDAKIIKTATDFRPLVNMNIQNLTFNKYLLGNLDINATYSYEDNSDKYIINTSLINNGNNIFNANGFIKNEKNSSPTANIELTANKLNIAPIGSFLNSIFSKFRGEADGKILLTGELKNPKYQGKLKISNLGFTVNFLGVDYQLTQPEDLIVRNGNFIFNDIELKDTKDNTHGKVSGFLQTKNFSEWLLNFDCNSDKILVLNTSIKDNDLFFGNIWASGEFSIYGSTVKGINIAAKAQALEGSKLTINSSSTTNATNINYIKFLPEQKIDNTEEDIPNKPPLGLTIRADVTADDKSVVNLIINQQTGDKIEVRGDAKNLKFNMSPAGRITMDGTYTITGASKYYYQMFVNKDFKIVPGSTIRWENRGPTDADLNITANYSRGVSNIGDYLGTSTIPTTNVTVTAKLTGYLSKPSISFDIDAEASGSIKDQLRSKLNNNEGEKYNQMAGIILFGSFLSDNMGGSSYASSAYDVVLKQLTSVINNISGAFSIDANFNAGSKVDNTSDRISLDPSFKLNQRLSIVGSVKMPLEQKSAADVWTYGAKVEYDISKNRDKSLIISGFSKPSTFGLDNSILDAYGANNQSYGGGIIYKRSFDRLSEILGRNKRKKDSIIIKK